MRAESKFKLGQNIDVVMLLVQFQEYNDFFLD